jgi:plastocyanin
MKTFLSKKKGRRLLLTAVTAVVFAAFLLSYCGGGGGGGGGGTMVTYSISGMVTLNGAALPGVTITLSGASSNVATTDSAGNYTFSGLMNGNYTLTPSLTGYTFSPTSSVKAISGANIAGVNFAASLNTGPTFSISGTVTSNGTGLVGVTMTLSGAGSAAVMSDSSGNYSFSGLVNGVYTITPSLAGFAFAPASSSQTIAGANVTAVNFTATSTTTVQLVPCPASGTTDVSIVEFAFNPSSITIPANSIVKWTNNGTITHTATSTTVPANGSFDSGFILPGQSVCFKFTTAGTYNYWCSIHTTLMTGVVTVQ